MLDNREIINKAANETITTGSLNNGLLNPEQARKFLQQTFDATELGKVVRHEMRTAKTGEIDKIGIDSRILRKKTENADDGYRANVKTNAIEYATTAVRLPWEITEETLRENIEGQHFEQIVTDLMTRQMGIDTEDLYLNGDESVSATLDGGGNNPDYDFLKINDGWIKQIKQDGHVFDASSADLNLDLFYNALHSIPNKYNNGNLRWIMSPHMRQSFELFLLNQVINKGGIVPESLYKSPAGVPNLESSRMAKDTILLTDPKNLIVVNTYGIKVRSTNEGNEAVMMDKRFYVIHFDYDPIIEETDATAIVTGLKVV